jgi:hypothetical protein
MFTATFLPQPDLIAEQIRARQEEVRTLRKLLNAARAAAKAEEVRKRLEAAAAGQKGGGDHAA